MKQALALSALVLVLVGCAGTTKTSGDGRRTYERFRDAFHKGDVDALWALYSHDSQSRLLDHTKARVAEALKDPVARQRLKADAGVQGDPTQLAPDVLTRALMARTVVNTDVELGGDALAKERYVSDRAEHGRVVVRVAVLDELPILGSYERVIEYVFVRESGGLRFDMPATERHEEERQRAEIMKKQSTSAVPVPGLGARPANHSTSLFEKEIGLAKYCPACQRAFGRDDERCPYDATPLQAKHP